MTVVQTKNENWTPACGGTEKPFTSRTGHYLQYMYCPATGEHAYIDLKTDIFVDNDTESLRAVGMIW